MEEPEQRLVDEQAGESDQAEAEGDFSFGGDSASGQV